MSAERRPRGDEAIVVQTLWLSVSRCTGVSTFEPLPRLAALVALDGTFVPESLFPMVGLVGQMEERKGKGTLQSLLAGQHSSKKTQW